MCEMMESEFVKLMSLFKSVKEAMPKADGISHAEWMVLHHLIYFSKENKKDEMVISDLQCRMNVTKPAVSQFLNTLEDKGYILREISSKDRRAVVVSITEKGNAMMKENMEKANRFFNVIIEKMGRGNFENMMNLAESMKNIIEQEKHTGSGTGEQS